MHVVNYTLFYFISLNLKQFFAIGKFNFNTETFDDALPLIINQLYINPSLHFVINIAFIVIVSRCHIIWKNGKFYYDIVL